MRFLITGGAGFIGSHLCDLLLAHEHDVHVLDDLSTGRIENSTTCETGRLRVHRRQRRRRSGCRTSSSPTPTSSCTSRRLSACDSSWTSPCARSRRTCTAPRWCWRTQTATRKPVMIASTSEVYGKSDALPFREDGDLQMGADRQSALGLRVLEGDRRVPGDGLLARARAAGHGRAPVQHRRTRGRPGATGWSFPGLSARRWQASR